MDLALNNLQWLIWHKTKANHSRSEWTWEIMAKKGYFTLLRAPMY